MSFQLSPSARRDPDEIVTRISQDDPDAAIAFVERMLDRCRLLGDWPLIGHERPDVRRGYRAWTEGDYVILYKPGRGGVLIARVVHGHRDFSALGEP